MLYNVCLVPQADAPKANAAAIKQVRVLFRYDSPFFAFIEKNQVDIS